LRILAVPMNSAREITFVLTSCGRFDLLADTIASFLACNTAPIARYVVIEDSGDAAVRDVLASFDCKLELLFNDVRRGQMASIDRAYSTVSTPYIFHCEDDWRFFRPGFVEESLLLLENDANISAVMCRRLGQNALHDMIANSVSVSCLGSVDFRQPALDVNRVWGGYHFNPGLRRLADYRRIGSFAQQGHEAEASVWFMRQGMGIAVLENPACETTGAGARHVHDSFAPLRWHERRGDVAPGGANKPGSRNEPCHCGSGQRYKHCHGATG
jgi:SEC-C motif